MGWHQLPDTLKSGKTTDVQCSSEKKEGKQCDMARPGYVEKSSNALVLSNCIYIICKYPCTVCERIFDEMLPPIPKELCNHLTDLSGVWSSELASSRRLTEVVASQKCPGRSGVKMSRLRVGKMSLSVF